jgi:hypothetical protein
MDESSAKAHQILSFQVIFNSFVILTFADIVPNRVSYLQRIKRTVNIMESCRTVQVVSCRGRNV